ncbi:MAG: ABC transporter ATP-binding protein, partial [Clostridia bacterium]|nr:ABC transporter ATP-binding protein [Clostridia bacterium]
YDSPCNLFVAGFMGTPQMNFITGKLLMKGTDLVAMFGTTEIKLPADKANNPDLKEYIGQEVIFGIRPEAIHDEPMYLASMSDTTMQVDVDVTELMGAEIYLYLGFEGMEDATNGKNIIARVSSRSTARSGDKITVAIDTSRIHIFDKDNEKCICH